MSRFSDTNMLLLKKPDGEIYLFHYSDEDTSKSECLRTLGRFASNQELSFSWHDAAVLSQRVCEIAIEHREAQA